MQKRGFFAVAQLLLVALFVACSSSNDGTAPADQGVGPATNCKEGDVGCLGWVQCPSGFERDSTPTEAASCMDIQPEADCAAGTMPVLGARECQPVGWTQCPQGFAKSASGWGCAPVLPDAGCTGATRESFGSSKCEPVGDCNAPFPPAGTTHFVNAAYTDAELDAKHFRTITSAIASVTGPGAVIAVESGNYTEGVWPKRAMTVVGRCADKVRLLGAGLQVPGVFSRGVKGVTVSGMTLEDHFQGVRAEGGGIITVSDLVIERPRLSGIIAYQPGSTVTASRVVVRETKAGSADSAGVGANADAGGLLDLTDIVLARNADVGISATNAAGESKTPSAVTGRRVFIRDTRPSKAAPAGSGVASFDGCSVALEESVIDKTYGFGVLVEIGGAQASFKNSVIRRTLLSTADGIGGGVLAYDGSVVNLDSVSIEGNEQGGIYARGRAQVTITGSSIEGNLPQADGAFGMGLFAD